MKVRIYKAGGTTGKFISRLERFTSLPTAAMGMQVNNEKELKQNIADLIDTYNLSDAIVIQQLVKGGYDYGYSKKLVDDVSNDIEEGIYASKRRRQRKKQSMLDSELIESEEERRAKRKEEEDLRTEADNKKSKDISEATAADIEEGFETEQEENDEDDAELEEEFQEDDEDRREENEASDEAMDLVTAQYGMEMKDDNYTIQWPGMEMDLNTMRRGGVPNKNKFINSTIKQLRKAEMGMQKDPSIKKQPNPFGTIDNPLGENLTPNKNIVSAIKNTAQTFVNNQRYKEQAEQMYNQKFENGGENDWATNLHNYGEALSHEMPNTNTTGMNTDFNGQQMARGGSSRRIRRANRAMFGLPTAPPFVDTNYEFGPLGGVRKAQATYDMSKMAEMLKSNPDLINAYMPKVNMGLPSARGIWNWWQGDAPGFNFNQTYNTTRTVITPAVRKLKWATQTINNAADPSKNNEGALNNNPERAKQLKAYQEYMDQYNYNAQMDPLAPDGARQAPVTFEDFLKKDTDGTSDYDFWSNRSAQSQMSTRASQPKQNLTDEEILNYNNFPSESQDRATASAIPPTYSPVTNKPIAPINTPVPRNEDVDFLNSNRFSDENLDESLMYPQDASNMMYSQESSSPTVSNATVTNSSPYSLTPKQTGSQTEEFCYPGQSCYQLSDDQSWDRDLFNELPQALVAYGANNMSDWFKVSEKFENSKIDLSKVTKKEIMEAIKSRISKNDLPRMKNLDEYIDKWLKFQRENQKAYGSTKTTDLYDYDFSGDSPKYADWLNVSGKAGAQNPYDIFSATPALDFEDYEKASGGPIVGVQPDQYGNLQKFVYGGNDYYAYGGGINMFPDGGEQIDLNYKDARGMNFQDYINRYNEMAADTRGGTFDPKTTSRAAPQTWAEWKAEQDAEKNPQPNNTKNSFTSTNTNTGTNTTTNTGNTTYNQDYFKKLFETDPNAKAEFEKYMQSKGFPTGSQLQQGQGNYQLTDRQGNPVIGMNPSKQGIGAMIGRAFGITKDFDYTTTPKDQIRHDLLMKMLTDAKNDPTKKVTETQFKEGKWWNPFDKDKRITEWEINPVTGQPTNNTNTNNTNKSTNGWHAPMALPGDNNATTTTTNTNASTSGSTTSVEGAQENVQAKDASGKIGRDQMLKTGVNPDTGENIGIGSKGELIDSPQFYNERNTQRYIGTDIDGEKMYENYGDKDRLNEAFDITGFSKKDFRKQGPALFGDTEGGTRSELANEYEGKGFFGKRKMRKDFMKNDLWDMPLDSSVINERRGNAKIAPNTFKGPFSKPGESNPMTDPKYIPTGEDFNFASPAVEGNNKPAPVIPQGNEDYLDPLPMAYGGYIPRYMAYGGYMPDYGYGGMMQYNPGGTVVGPNPDFAGVQQNNIAEDKDGNKIPDYLEAGKDPAMGTNTPSNTTPTPNKIRIEEQTARTWDPQVTNNAGRKSLAGWSKFDQMREFTKSRQNEMEDIMYAQDIDRQLTYKGIQRINDGIDPKAGFESGRTYSKFGGPKDSNSSKSYSKGKVYSLTMDEIREIQRNGGSVKFIK